MITKLGNDLTQETDAIVESAYSSPFYNFGPAERARQHAWKIRKSLGNINSRGKKLDYDDTFGMVEGPKASETELDEEIAKRKSYLKAYKAFLDNSKFRRGAINTALAANTVTGVVGGPFGAAATGVGLMNRALFRKLLREKIPGNIEAQMASLEKLRGKGKDKK